MHYDLIPKQCLYHVTVHNLTRVVTKELTSFKFEELRKSRGAVVIASRFTLKVQQAFPRNYVHNFAE